MLSEVYIVNIVAVRLSKVLVNPCFVGAVLAIEIFVLYQSSLQLCLCIDLGKTFVILM